MRLRPTALLAAFVTIAAIAPAAPAADLERARKIVSGRCFLCHGMEGESSSEVFPRLATQNAKYLAKQLKDFQTGRRKGTTMNSMVAGITDAEMADLGAFFEARKADPHAPSDAASPPWGATSTRRATPFRASPPAPAATARRRTARRRCRGWPGSNRSTSRASSGRSTGASATTT